MPINQPYASSDDLPTATPDAAGGVTGAEGGVGAPDVAGEGAGAGGGVGATAERMPLTQFPLGRVSAGHG